MKKKLYLHIGYPRTATTTFQKHLYEKHPDINYLGKHISYRNSGDFLKYDQKINTIFDAVLHLSNEEFNKKRIQLLEQIKFLKLSIDKLNLFSDEYIILNSIYYGNAKTDKLKIFLIRVTDLFLQANIEINFIVTIRRHVDLIASLYKASNNNFFNISELIDFFKNKKTHNDKIKIFVEGLLFFGNFLECINKYNNVNFFLYENLKTDQRKYLEQFSDILNIDSEVSKKLLNDKIENSSQILENENSNINNLIKVIYFKIKRNIQYDISIKFLAVKFYSFFFILFSFLKKKIIKQQYNNKVFKNNFKINIKEKINLDLKKIYENEKLISNYYHSDLEDLLSFSKKDLHKLIK